MTKQRRLFVVATEAEARGIFPNHGFSFTVGLEKGEWDSLLITGVGLVQTLHALHTLVDPEQYALIFQLGIAGVFPVSAQNRRLHLADLVIVQKEGLADLGAEDAEGFHRFAQPDLAWPAVPSQSSSLGDLPLVKSATVQQCTGTLKTAQYRENLDFEIENMEGYSFFLWAQNVKTPCYQVRSLSNIATVRNKASWKIAEALNSLRKFVDDYQN